MTLAEVPVSDQPSIEDEIAGLAKQLKPREFRARLAMWTKGGLPGGMSADLVKVSRSAKLSALDRMDVAIEQANDRYRDHVIDAHAARARGDLRKALRLLQAAVAIQETWLYPIEVASPDLAELTSDSPVCRKCKGSKEMWKRAKKRTPWRIKAGLGPCCYQTWLNQGRPDLPPMDAKSMTEAAS